MTDGSNEQLRKDLTPDEFTLFRDWIHHHSGIFLEDSKVDSLRISLVTRATRFNFNEYQDYFRFLSNDEGEFKELMNLVTINETSFFRFPAQFDAFRDKVIPEIIDGRTMVNKRFRVWSAGCSTGEEPYTISMSLLDSALEHLDYVREVVGTDVSTQALEKARRGIYPQRATAALDPGVRARYFEPLPDGYRPVKRVRDLCTFHFHNLIKEPYPAALLSNWDVIFCRNVTIYFRLESTRRVVNNFYEALNPGGYLFIGHSETLTSISERFEVMEVDGVFLYRKPHAKRLFTFDDIVARRQDRRSYNPAGPSGPGRKDAVPDREQMRAARHERQARAAREAEKTAEDAQEAATTGEQARVLVEQAHVMLEQARHAEALEYALKAIELQPRDLDAHLVAAFAYADTGQFESAMRQADEALRVNPLAAPARYILGIIHQQLGNSVLALSEFKRTLYIDSDFVLAHFACANLYRQQGSVDDACREYENTLRSMHVNPEGSWTAFMGGFRTDLIQRTCERSLIECGKGGK